MKSDWSSLPLAECGKWISGGTPSKSNPEYWNGDIPWVSPKDMDCRFITDAQDHVTPQGIQAGSKQVPKDTILIVVRSMTLANRVQIAITERDVAFNQDLKAIVCHERILPQFLFYALLAKSDSILRIVDEATHGTKRLRSEVLGGLILPLPPLSEQQTIAHIPGTLDGKIELNHSMNETLDAIACTFFKLWFKDFDLTHLSERNHDSVDIEPQNLRLFPDEGEELKSSELPTGWLIKPLDQIAEFLNGLALQNFPPVGDIYLPVIKIAELRRGDTASSDRASAFLDQKYIVDDGDILFSWSGSLEARIWCGGRGALNQHFLK